MRRNEISRAVVALRKALGKTQQEFAVEILKTAITTVARYETSHPPQGDVLLRLAAISEANQQHQLGQTFRALYLEDIFGKAGDRLTLAKGTGYLMQRLTTPEEFQAGRCFMGLLDKMRSSDKRDRAKAEELLASLLQINRGDQVDEALSSFSNAAMKYEQQRFGKGKGKI